MQDSGGCQGDHQVVPEAPPSFKGHRILYPAPPQILLARGASPQLVCGNHGTPLHSAAGAGAGAAARLLLAGGASAAALWEGRTPAELAAQSGHLRTAALLSKVAWGQLRFPGSPLPAASQEAADGGAVYEGQSSPTRALDPGDAGGSVAVAGTAGSSGSLAAAGRGSSVDDAGQPGSPRAVVATHQALCSSIASTGSEHSSGVGWLTPGWEEKPMPGWCALSGPPPPHTCRSSRLAWFTVACGLATLSLKAPPALLSPYFTWHVSPLPVCLQSRLCRHARLAGNPQASRRSRASLRWDGTAGRGSAPGSAHRLASRCDPWHEPPMPSRRRCFGASVCVLVACS